MNVYYAVYRTGRTFGVFRQPASDGTGQEMIEGGFFTRSAAEAAARAWEKGER